MLITFEGIDGSGKSTQISMLRKALEQKGYSVQVFREPGGTDLSEMIRGMLLNPELDMDPVTEMLLFSAARSQLVAEKIKPLVNSEVIVILDRFFDSTTAYQGYGRESLPIPLIEQVNKVATHGMVPDLTLYLRISPEIAEERTRESAKDRMEQSGDSFFKKVYEGYEKLAASEPRFQIINSDQKAEQTHQEIMKCVFPRLTAMH